jgi:hypothetical protein
MQEALAVLLNEAAKGLSPAVVSRRKAGLLALSDGYRHHCGLGRHITHPPPGAGSPVFSCARRACRDSS